MPGLSVCWRKVGARFGAPGAHVCRLCGHLGRASRVSCRAAPPQSAGRISSRLVQARPAVRRDERPRRCGVRRRRRRPRRGPHRAALRLRAAVGTDVLTGRSDELTLPRCARRVEQALAPYTAESAVVQGDWARPGMALCAQFGPRARCSRCWTPWLGAWRRRLEDTYQRVRGVRRGLPRAWRDRAGRRRTCRTPAARHDTARDRVLPARAGIAERGQVPEALSVYEQGRTVLPARSSASPAKPWRRSTCSCSKAAGSAREASAHTLRPTLAGPSSASTLDAGPRPDCAAPRPAGG